ncbi:phosphomannomutase [Jannaschia sp. CCS1]|uniref:phosphomannomutase n=1 Tax=Jannaschia sp. (strain CCS1) TaxID=290400 RepID=UPI000053B82A|nr:phosphomannomutase [Jannaschia sp. CCS1]ABD57132.1 phosphoglucomutase/phosphomannomutase alpha/beta/alpha domain I [Jannaschia sp. CCS1]
MPPKFGTSGLRGLVVDLTDALVSDYVRAFLAACDIGGSLCVGRDLRSSSPHLAGVVAEAARAQGVAVTDCGALPTPALALAAAQSGCGAVMVTGSHIPDDRNGLKFYSLQGEITKTDETAILAAHDAPAETPPSDPAPLSRDTEATGRFHARYLRAFGAGALAGARIGVWSHSSVGRDLLIGLLRDLGAEVTDLGRSEVFVPVDTEAVDAPTRARLRDWAAEGGFDAIVSTDGDADRPLLTDATGEVVPGDVMGQITAQYLGADVVVTPVSSNGGVELGGGLRVVRTKIGSPFVIAALEDLSGQRAVGYEANGGFLLGFEARSFMAPLAALMTRDCVLPILSTLMAARGPDGRIDVGTRVAQEPARFTAADRITEMPVATSNQILNRLLETDNARAVLLQDVGLSPEHSIETTDGLRMTDQTGAVLHLRPSGNAPEFRVYIEADDPAAAQTLLARALTVINKMKA